MNAYIEYEMNCVGDADIKDGAIDVGHRIGVTDETYKYDGTNWRWTGNVETYQDDTHTVRVNNKCFPGNYWSFISANRPTTAAIKTSLEGQIDSYHGSGHHTLQ